jgi:hypothetical protein
MPSSSEKQRNYIFYLRGKYKSKENTPEDEKWIWDSGWNKIKEAQLPKGWKLKKDSPGKFTIISPKGNSTKFKNTTPDEIIDWAIGQQQQLDDFNATKHLTVCPKCFNYYDKKERSCPYCNPIKENTYTKNQIKDILMNRLKFKTIDLTPDYAKWIWNVNDSELELNENKGIVARERYTKFFEDEINSDEIKLLYPEVYLLNINKEENYLFIKSKKGTKTINLPKNLTKDWILTQIEKILNFSSKKLYPIFKLLNLKGGRIYYTSYGIGYDCFMQSKSIFDKEVNEIEEILNKYDIKFKGQFSDKFYVYRFIISTSAENLNKIKDL